jgi:hypothetical protein
MSSRTGLWGPCVLALSLASAGVASADRIDDLTRALVQDGSYKVRVQAALVLGKLGDRRAVPSLIHALSDSNESVRGVAATSLGKIADPTAGDALSRAATGDASEFVRNQARKALELLAGGGGVDLPPPRAGARYYLTVGFGGQQKGGPQAATLVKQGLVRELAKLPGVTVGGDTTQQALAQKKLEGYIVDGQIVRLAVTPGGGTVQIDCDLKAYVATYPGRAIKMMTTEGASLETGGGASAAETGKRDCLNAAIEAVRDDVGKFLQTLR